MRQLMYRRRALLGLALLLLLAWVVTAWLWRDDPLDRIKQMRQELFSEAGRKLPPEERKEGFKKLRDEMKQLSAAQRKELFAERQKKVADRLKSFFKLSPEERLKELDKQLDRVLAARQRRQDRLTQAGQSGDLNSNNGAGNARSGRAGGGGADGSGGPGDPGGGPGGWGGPKSPEQREAWRQLMLDNTSPEFRGEMAEYRQLLGSRAQQRGMPSGGGWGWGGRGPW